MSDLLLRGVRVGLAGPVADVHLSNGTVAAIEPPGHRPAAGTPVFEGRGGTLLPGLVDAHVHVLHQARHRRTIALGGARSAHEAVELLREAALKRAASTGELIVGTGFRDGLWPDKPHKDLLQRALPDRPIALSSADLHTLWLSPAALRLIGREHPTGVLLENDCMSATAALPSASVALLDQWVAEALHAASARGVTEVVDYEYADTVADWSRRAEAARPATRISCVIARHLLDTTVERGHRTGDVLAAGDGMVRVGPFKLFVDGSLNTRTAYCHHPYPDSGDLGQLELPPEQLVPLMRRATENGLVPAVHAIGDKANTIALDAFAALGRGGRIEHAQLLAPADVPRFAALGVVVGVQPAHQPDDRDVADHHWVGRTGRAFAYRALLDSGARLEFGSDAPVAPLDPWDGIAAAVSRTDDDRPAWHPEQAISLVEALASSSVGRRGIAVGDVADLVVTETDPTGLTAADLRNLPVSATVVAGRVVHPRQLP